MVSANYKHPVYACESQMKKINFLFVALRKPFASSYFAETVICDVVLYKSPESRFHATKTEGTERHRRDPRPGIDVRADI